jgi:hypothetical protein
MRSVLTLSCVVGILAASLVSAAPGASGPSGKVTGAITTNGQKASLTVGYVDESPEDLVLMLASKTLPPDSAPFIGEDTARKLGIHAVSVTVTRATKKLDPQGLNGVYYPGKEMGFSGLLVTNVTLQVTRLDATGIEGRIFTAKPITLSDLTYSFDVTFAMPLGKAAPAAAPVVVRVSGDVTSPPTAVYVEYYRAAHAGDARTIRGFLSAAASKEFDTTDAKVRSMMLDLLKDRPSEIQIAKPAVTGGKATFTVSGLNLASTKQSATVTMVLEGGAWKVEKDSWSITSK